MSRPSRGLLAPRAVEEVPEVVDASRDARMERIAALWGSGATEVYVIRTIVKEFGVRPDQVKRDLGDIRDHLRNELDNEYAIDQVMMYASARARTMADTFAEQALQPIPTRVLQYPSPDPENPHGPGAVYRELTPAEVSALTTARTTAGRTALAALEFFTKLRGKRSVRWADKPSNVIAIQVNNQGLSAEDIELLRTLGMGQ